MKTPILWLLKVMAAGILALSIASVICLIYYNPGIHITNETGATDYVWRSNCFAATMTEGIAWSRTDKNGFYNEADTDKNMDILVMGSSHMEGLNVFPEQKTSFLLRKLTNKTVYDIGTSGHELLTCVKNLENALTVMEPTEYVIIETMTVTLSEEAVNECLSGNLAAIPSYDGGILFQLQKIPYLKLVYAQLESWRGTANDDVVTQSAEEVGETDNAQLAENYGQLAHKISEICTAHNVQPIIFFHPQMTLNSDGTAVVNTDKKYLNAFSSACQENNIIFIDMTEDFINMYNEEHILPHGFCNTSVGTGHLNRYGYEVIAERLAKTISDNSDDAEGNNK